jgi:hypothetical protein
LPLACCVDRLALPAGEPGRVSGELVAAVGRAEPPRASAEGRSGVAGRFDGHAAAGIGDHAALQKVTLGLVDQHLRHCVLEAVTASPEAGEQRLA